MPGITGPGIKGPGIVGPGIKGTGIIGGGGGGGGDPSYASVVALLHMDAADGSEVYVDEKGHNFLNTFPGSTFQSSLNPKFGSASLRGVDINGLRSPVSAEFVIPSGPFTMETWLRVDTHAVGGDRRPFSFSHNGGGFSFINLTIFTNGTLAVTSVGVLIFGNTILALNTWYHVAITRDVNDLVTLWLNGVSDGTPWPYPDAGTGTGRVILAGGNSSLNGNMDDFRFTKGVCRYTAPFAPPTAPFPNS